MLRSHSWCGDEDGCRGGSGQGQNRTADTRIFSSSQHRVASESTRQHQTVTAHLQALRPPPQAAVVLVVSATGSGCGGRSGDSSAGSLIRAVALLPLFPTATHARVVPSTGHECKSLLLAASRREVTTVTACLGPDEQAQGFRIVWVNSRLEKKP